MPKKCMSETKVGQAVQEFLEDRVAECIRHCQDTLTVDNKPCEVTIKILVTPNKARDQFGFSVSASTKLSPRYSAEGTLFASVSPEGEVSVKEFDNTQASIPFNQ